jgi:hypothetical protein
MYRWNRGLPLAILCIVVFSIPISVRKQTSNRHCIVSVSVYRDTAFLAGKQPPSNPFFQPPKPPDDIRQQGTDKATLPLDSGPVMLTWPENIDKDGVEDMEEWFKVVMRRLRRKAGMAAK